MEFPVSLLIYSQSFSTQWWPSVLIAKWWFFYFNHPVLVDFLSEGRAAYLYNFSVDSWFLFYSVDSNPLPSLFWCSYCPRFGLWEPLRAGFLSFWHNHILWWNSLWGTKVSPRHILTHLYFFRPEIGDGSLDPWFFSWRMEFSNQDLGTWYTHCYQGVIASKLSQQRELGNQCMNTYIISISIIIYTLNPWIDTNIPNSNPVPRGSFCSLHLWNALLCAVWKQDTPIYLLVQS